MDRPTSNRLGIWNLTCGLALLCLLGGCQSFSLFGNRDTADKSRDLARTDEVSGPLERLLTIRKKKDENKYIPGYYDKGRDELAEAVALAEDKKYPEAEKELKRILKTYQRYAVREDAMFFLGEVWFQTKQYPEAQDMFDGLIQDFPSTKYKEDISRRMFTIAGTWLGFPDVVTPSDIQLASSNAEAASATKFSEKRQESWDPTLSYPLLPNWHDGTRPMFDTQGRAVQALKTIWLENPSSPLADDALMMTASHYLREGKHEIADDYFAILRQQYPKSPHFENSYVLGSHVKLMSYQGSEYDGTRLDEAAQLKESSLKMFGDSAHSERLKQDLVEIEEAKARREWSRVEFYLKKNRPDSAAVYARTILDVFPNTKVAPQAKEFLKQHESPVAQKNSGWDWNFFPRLEKVPEQDSTRALEDEATGRTTISPYDEETGKTTFSPEFE